MRKLVAIGAAGLLGLAICAPASARSQGPSIVDTAIAVNASAGEFDHLIEAVVRATWSQPSTATASSRCSRLPTPRSKTCSTPSASRA